MPELTLLLSDLEPETIEVVSRPTSSEVDLEGLIMGLDETEISGVENILLYGANSCTCMPCSDCNACCCCCARNDPPEDMRS